MKPETIVTFGTQYPTGILINSKEETPGLWSASAFLLYENGEAGDLLVDTEPKYDTQEEAEQYLHDFGQWCVDYVKENEVFDAE